MVEELRRVRENRFQGNKCCNWWWEYPRDAINLGNLMASFNVIQYLDTILFERRASLMWRWRYLQRGKCSLIVLRVQLWRSWFYLEVCCCWVPKSTVPEHHWWRWLLIRASEAQPNQSKITTTQSVTPINECRNNKWRGINFLTFILHFHSPKWRLGVPSIVNRGWDQVWVSAGRTDGGALR